MALTAVGSRTASARWVGATALANATLLAHAHTHLCHWHHFRAHALCSSTHWLWASWGEHIERISVTACLDSRRAAGRWISFAFCAVTTLPLALAKSRHSHHVAHHWEHVLATTLLVTLLIRHLSKLGEHRGHDQSKTEHLDKGFERIGRSKQRSSEGARCELEPKWLRLLPLSTVDKQYQERWETMGDWYQKRIEETGDSISSHFIWNYAMSVEMIYLNHTLNMAIRTRIKKTW